MLRPRRRNAETTIPHHGRRDTMPRRDAKHPIPHDLGIVVGVNVDESRRYNQSASVDRLCAFAGNLANGGDPPILYGNVTTESLAPRAVYNAATDNLQVVVHIVHSSLYWS